MLKYFQTLQQETTLPELISHQRQLEYQFCFSFFFFFYLTAPKTRKTIPSLAGKSLKRARSTARCTHTVTLIDTEAAKFPVIHSLLQLLQFLLTAATQQRLRVGDSALFLREAKPY